MPAWRIIIVELKQSVDDIIVKILYIGNLKANHVNYNAGFLPASDCTKFVFGWGLPQTPPRSLQRSPDTYSWFKGTQLLWEIGASGRGERKNAIDCYIFSRIHVLIHLWSCHTYKPVDRFTEGKGEARLQPPLLIPGSAPGRCYRRRRQTPATTTSLANLHCVVGPVIIWTLVGARSNQAPQAQGVTCLRPCKPLVL